MLIFALALTQHASAVEIAISPVTAQVPEGFPCGGAIETYLAWTAWDECPSISTVWIPLTPMIVGHVIHDITVCYRTELGPKSYAEGFQFRVVESLDPGVQTELWSDGLWRSANPGVCEVIPVEVSPAGTPYLEVSGWMQWSQGDNLYLGQIWMNVGK